MYYSDIFVLSIAYLSINNVVHIVHAIGFATCIGIQYYLFSHPPIFIVILSTLGFYAVATIAHNETCSSIKLPLSSLAQVNMSI